MKQQIIDEINKRAKPLHTSQDLEPLMDEIGEIPIVLLGEATHGSAEFYKWRFEMTKKLIVEKGFNAVVVEGDWPPCFELNRYVKGKAHQDTDLKTLLKQLFNYYPSWVLGNEEMIPVIEWVKDYNRELPEEEKIGFYGNDVKSLWESLEEVIRYLERTESDELVAMAKMIYANLESSQRNPQIYGLNAMFFGQSVAEDVEALYQKVVESRKDLKDIDDEQFNDEINAFVMRNSERYWRSMATEGPDNWNIRVYHMVDMIYRLMEYHGEQSKIIVWGHNTHFGDARATEGMPLEGFVNEGQVIREQKGEDQVYILGFSTYSGEVIASTAWNEPLQVMEVPPAVEGSWDALLHEAGAEDRLLIFGKDEPVFSTSIPQRAIGAVYRPHEVEYQTYVATRLSDRYNALIHIDQTRPVKPLLPK
ncbi:hypothetical protein BEP19_00690 [Ammoniphilus oxalaticus]|uniref:Protein-L-isoaspartate O-methyltransferase n=1 Tax=Ammoniphilus oxalaticus TaxID=66863 RepID=A0A419SRJ6_9BACL|nr:erythromycin esterase family protein [Ammoniphilus oxalaticus]RKD27119.1 hypothetical protein BEP19_00690 [Ammoniphilus oxalaticus]